MNILKKIILIAIVASASILSAQEKGIKENIDGAYHMTFKERGLKNRMFQLVNSNGSEMLAMADCEQCPPAFLIYDTEGTKNLGKPVFTYRGYYVITYDKESFVAVMLSLKEGEDFASANFYSKNKEKAMRMTKEKIEAYALSY